MSRAALASTTMRSPSWEDVRTGGESNVDRSASGESPECESGGALVRVLGVTDGHPLVRVSDPSIPS